MTFIAMLICQMDPDGISCLCSDPNHHTLPTALTAISSKRLDTDVEGLTSAGGGKRDFPQAALGSIWIVHVTSHLVRFTSIIDLHMHLTGYQ